LKSGINYTLLRAIITSLTYSDLTSANQQWSLLSLLTYADVTPNEYSTLRTYVRIIVNKSRVS